MRLSDSDGKPDQPINDPIYYPTNCPLHRKYSILKEKVRKQQQLLEVQVDEAQETPTAPEVAADLDPAAGILAIAGIIITVIFK